MQVVDKVDQVVEKVEESKEKCYEGSSYLVSIVCFLIHCDVSFVLTTV